MLLAEGLAVSLADAPCDDDAVALATAEVAPVGVADASADGVSVGNAVTDALGDSLASDGAVAVIEGDGASAPLRPSSAAEGKDEVEGEAVDDAADGAVAGDEDAKADSAVADIDAVGSALAVLVEVVAELGLLGVGLDDTQIGGTSSGMAHAMSRASSLPGLRDCSSAESVVAVAAVAE